MIDKKDKLNKEDDEAEESVEIPHYRDSIEAKKAKANDEIYNPKTPVVDSHKTKINLRKTSIGQSNHHKAEDTEG